MMRLTCKLVYFLGLLAGLAAPTLAQVRLDALQFAEDEGRATAVFTLSGDTTYTLFTLRQPHRLVVDFEHTVPRPGLLPLALEGAGTVLAVRHGLQADGRLRIVFDLRQRVVLAMERWRAGNGARELRLAFGPRAAAEPARAGEAEAPATKPASGSPGAALAGEKGPGGDGAADGSLVFGSRTAASPASAPDPSRRWQPRLERGLVEGGYLFSDPLRHGSNLHVQSLASLTGALGAGWELRLGARVDGHFQAGGAESVDMAELEYDENWLRFRGQAWRLTAGTQRIIWGRTDELSPTDRLSTRDFTRLILDDLPDRRRTNPALRVEWFGENFSLDAVYLPVFREAVLPDPGSIWFPVDSQRGAIAGLKLPPGLASSLRGASLRNEASGAGGGGLRLKRFGEALDYAITVQRVRNPEPYFVSGGLDGGSVVLDTVYPRTWVVGGDLGVALASWTLRFEGAWLSDMPYTGNDLRLRTGDALDWVLGAEVFPGDRDLRLTLQVAGTHRLDADPAIDRKNILGLTGELEGPFPGNRWRGQLRYWFGLDSDNVYLNPEIVFIAREPSEFYIGMHLFAGERGTPGAFYDGVDMIVLGWRGRF